MTKAELLALAERCEAATGPDRELDAETLSIFGLAGWTGAPSFATSLDAAMTLIPHEWTAWELRSRAKKTLFSANLSRISECDAGEDWAHATGPTPALALTAACLRALAATMEE